MIKIDYRNKEPVFKQVQNELMRLIVLGVYPADSQLPSVRVLAVELGVNPNTIQKAYRELEISGVIYSVSGKGSFVSQKDNAQEIVREKHIAEFENAVKSAFYAQLTKQELVLKIEEIYSSKDR